MAISSEAPELALSIPRMDGETGAQLLPAELYQNAYMCLQEAGSYLVRASVVSVDPRSIADQSLWRLETGSRPHTQDEELPYAYLSAALSSADKRAVVGPIAVTLTQTAHEVHIVHGSPSSNDQYLLSPDGGVEEFREYWSGRLRLPVDIGSLVLEFLANANIDDNTAEQSAPLVLQSMELD